MDQPVEGALTFREYLLVLRLWALSLDVEAEIGSRVTRIEGLEEVIESAKRIGAALGWEDPERAKKLR
jgi:hypothetical protein